MAKRRLGRPSGRHDAPPSKSPPGYLALWVLVLALVAALAFAFWPRRSLQEEAGLTDKEHEYVRSVLQEEIIHQQDWKNVDPTPEQVRERYLFLAEQVKKARKR